ncbi:MAG: isochorismatase family cysteine hydrolase [Enterococcus sp.]
MKHSALVIIDLQRGIKGLFKKVQPYTWEQVLTNNEQLIQKFISHGAPIYLVSVQPSFFPGAMKQKFGSLLLAEKRTSPLIKSVIKTGPSMFGNSTYDLAKELSEQGIKEIFLTGVSTSNGVLKTAKDGQKLGFDISIIEDACSDRKRASHDQSIEQLAQFAKICQTTDF